MDIRHACAAVCFAALLCAQDTTIKTTVRLVSVPTSVTDHKGEPIYGLTESDFLVTDNGRPRSVHVTASEESLAPIALAVVVQTSGVTSAAMAKIEKVGAMIPEAVAGARAEVAVVTYDDHIRLVQNFTSNADQLANAFRALKTNDTERARMVDAVGVAIQLLQMRNGTQRASILVVGETRDRGSESDLQDVLDRAQRAGITVYGINYSAYWTPFTAKPGDYQPANGGGGDWILGSITEAARIAKGNTIEALVLATGGRRFGFLTQSKLENDLIGLGKEMHSRYLLTFTPELNASPGFHKIEVSIKQKPGVTIHATPGYWLDSE
jgi:VWFA-related protein